MNLIKFKDLFNNFVTTAIIEYHDQNDPMFAISRRTCKIRYRIDKITAGIMDRPTFIDYTAEYTACPSLESGAVKYRSVGYIQISTGKITVVDCYPAINDQGVME